MQTTIHTMFDGKVFKPEETVSFPPNTRFVLKIEPASEEEHPLTKIRQLAVDMGVNDLAEKHKHYAHGKGNSGTL